MDSARYGAKLEAALSASLARISKGRIIWSKDDKPFLSIVEAVPAPTKTPRLRTVSATGTGRGTGRGRKDPAGALIRPLKFKGPRADFVRFIGGRETSIQSVVDRFEMTRPNINAYLTNLHRDHGVGYEKDAASVKLLLPPLATWSNIWKAD